MDGRVSISGGPASAPSLAAGDFRGEPGWTREAELSRARRSAGVLAAEPPVPAGTAVGVVPPAAPPPPLPPALPPLPLPPPLAVPPPLPLPPLIAVNWAWASFRCDCSRDRNDFAYDTTLELLPWLISCCALAMDCWWPPT